MGAWLTNSGVRGEVYLLCNPLKKTEGLVENIYWMFNV